MGWNDFAFWVLGYKIEFQKITYFHIEEKHFVAWYRAMFPDMHRTSVVYSLHLFLTLTP